MSDRLEETWPRFLAHWVSASFGFGIRECLPTLHRWIHTADVAWPRWWAVVLYAFAVTLVGGVISSNLPPKPREIVKSIVLGFGLNAAVVLARLQ